ncbi:MAG: class I SAM-dependent methyltransferase [Alphaproteobacteria bacterium]
MAMIKESGPLDLADYMRIALTDPEHGYYTNAAALGADGDFITAPEISQMFGELIGLWVVDTWNRLGSPEDVKLVELGPGRGTLIADALRAIRAASDMPIDLHLVEVNPLLEAEQAKRVNAAWWDSIEQVPPGPMILIANEFFDTLPIQQMTKTPDGWRRTVVKAEGERLIAEPGPSTAPPIWAAEDFPDGSIIETSEEVISLARLLGRRVHAHGGAALIIDYGNETSAPGSSLQAVSAHVYADPFDDPGQADLTAHVDFQALAEAAITAGAAVAGPVTQNAFLNALGLPARADALKRSANPAQAREIDLAAHRLTAPDQMGTLFKVLAIKSPSLSSLAGL